MSTTTLIQPARRSALLGFSDIVKIRNRVLEMRARGMRVLQLEGGEPFMPTPDFIKDAMKAAVDANYTRYAPSSGIPQLLDAIRAKLASRNRIQVANDRLIVTSGGAHGLFCAFQASVNPGDEVMFFAPYWTPIHDQVGFAGGVPIHIPWDEVRGCGDIDDLVRSRITDRTRVIYVNTPANPSGDMLTRGQLESIARAANDHNLIVISDEAYEDLVWDPSTSLGAGAEHVSIASLPGMFERTISVFTLSKTFAMTGWRIGYVVADTPIMEFLRKLVLNTTNGVSTPTQYAAAAAIAHSRAWLDTVRSEYRRRRDLLLGGLRDAGFLCHTPPGAFYTFPDVRGRLGNSSWQAMETVLERTSIASVPGVVFGPEGEGHLRLSFSQSIEVIEEAVEALARL